MHGAILGGKNRVAGTLHPIRGSVHPAGTLAGILELQLWGMMKRGFLWKTSNNLSSRMGVESLRGKEWSNEVAYY